MKIFKYILLFISIISIISIEPDSNDWEQPKDLSKMKILYKSGEIGSYEKPIIAYNNVYFMYDDNTNIININNGKKSNLYPNNLTPILYINTVFNYYSLFLTKDCIIYIYKENSENTFDNKYLFQRKFNNFDSYCGALRIYYETKTKTAAIYNENSSNKIIVLNLEKSKNGEKDIVKEFDNYYKVHQSLIYANSNRDKSLLIISDSVGIKFYNLKGYAKTFFGGNDLGKLVKSSDLGYYGNIDFIGGNKVIWSFSVFFSVFDLDNNINLVTQKKFFLPGSNLTECLLGLKDGKVLVGSKSGYLFLIEYKGGDLYIIDSRQICNSPISRLSFSNNCEEGKIYCYTIAANCGKIIVFQIGIYGDDNFLGSDFSPLYGIASILIMCIIIYLYKKKNN